MQASLIDIQTFQPDHLDAAVELSRQAGWPHRKEDWALVLSLSKGFVALENGRVVGTAMATILGDTCATVNMVIVDESMRGRGLGRQLMGAAMDAAENRECRLVATADGLPLYESWASPPAEKCSSIRAFRPRPTGRKVSPGRKALIRPNSPRSMRRLSVRIARPSLQHLPTGRVSHSCRNREASRALQHFAPSGAAKSSARSWRKMLKSRKN